MSNAPNRLPTECFSKDKQIGEQLMHSGRLEVRDVDAPQRPTGASRRRVLSASSREAPEQVSAVEACQPPPRAVPTPGIENITISSGKKRGGAMGWPLPRGYLAVGL